MNSGLYPRTGAYRKLYSTFDLFFEEVELTYGKQNCQEVKRDALKDSLKLEDITKIDELDLLERMHLRHPEIREMLNAQARIIIGGDVSWADFRPRGNKYVLFFKSILAKILTPVF